MAEKGTDTPPAVTAQGSSVSWTARKKGVLNIWEAFWQYYCEKEKVKGPNSTGGSAIVERAAKHARVCHARRPSISALQAAECHGGEDARRDAEDENRDGPPCG